MDCEASFHFAGKFPGTTTINGYSEEYRLHQLALLPAINLQFESTVGFPVVSLADVVTRLKGLNMLRLSEDTPGLLPFLGLSQLNILQFGFGSTGTLQQRIDNLCYMLTRSYYDFPTRFHDFAKMRNFSPIIRTGQVQEAQLRNFLFQILIGAELWIRLDLQATPAAYSGIITENIASLLVAAHLFMLNVSITVVPQSTVLNAVGGTTTNGPFYKFKSLNHHNNGVGLLKYAETIGWPLMDEVKRSVATATSELDAGRMPPGDDLCDWLYGLILPGKVFRHRIMCALVQATPSIRDMKGAPFYENGIVVKDKSFWPQRTVLGRVLGGVRSMKSTCGWIGPAPAPKGTGVLGGAVSGWVRLSVRAVLIPTPLVKLAKPFEAYGYEDDNPAADIERLEAILKPESYVLPEPIRPAQDHSGSVLKDIYLDLIPGMQSNLSILTSGLPPETYRASIDFEVNGVLVKYTLYHNPVFIAGPPCVGSHPMFKKAAEKRIKEAVPVAKLKTTYAALGKLLIINALGDGDEVVARAWCAEQGKNAIVRRDQHGSECCFTCACNLAVGDTGLNINVLIWGK
ncbi:hypothetical protein BX600DRAFT_473258 [Xylariales sp. PMI_506]|nr:hypothetical protein BX600DRAFT_473258 [Xylariales sp. PMI_506]